MILGIGLEFSMVFLIGFECMLNVSSWFRHFRTDLIFLSLLRAHLHISPGLSSSRLPLWELRICIYFCVLVLSRGQSDLQSKPLPTKLYAG